MLGEKEGTHHAGCVLKLAAGECARAATREHVGHLRHIKAHNLPVGRQRRLQSTPHTCQQCTLLACKKDRKSRLGFLSLCLASAVLLL